MFETDLLLSLQLWFITFIFGIISLPLATKLFSNLFDKGYFLGKLLGFFAVSYALFTLSTLKILPLGFASLSILILIWTAINLFVSRKTKKLDIPWKLIIFEELIFLALYFLFIYIKGHHPEIYQIERFMDYGFIKALTSVNFLPLEDIWRAGGPLNYYYFGHFLAYVLITLSKVGTLAGFYLVQCWLFASAGVLAFIAGASVVKNWKYSLKWAIFAGFLSLFAVIFAGDWHSTGWYLDYLKSSIQNLPPPNFWYPEPTRIIPGTISEIPIYSFIVADLHAHVWGFLLGGVLVLSLVSIWFSQNITKKSLLFLSFILGLCIITNTWDFLTLGSLVALTFLFKPSTLNILSRIISITCSFIAAFLFSLPWFVFFNSPLSGIGIVTSWSPVVPWLLFWGPSIFLIALYFLSRLKTKLDFKQEGLIVILFFASLVWLISLEVFYMKDILSSGEWFRANTYFKVSLQILLWVGLITGPTIFAVLIKLSKTPKYILALVFTLWLLSRLVYPIKATYQSSLEGKTYTGLSSGLTFWQNKFPEEYQAFKFLETKPRGVILEADGDSYQDTSFFSTFLGWPTVTGWAVHEWTWHGTYDDVAKRVEEVKEIYTGTDFKKTQELIKKYNIKYIVIGQAENRKYGTNINRQKLNQLGKSTFRNSDAEIFQLTLN